MASTFGSYSCVRPDRGDRAIITGRLPLSPTIPAIVALVLILTACGSPSLQPAASSLSTLPAPTTRPFALTIIHSNDTWGYLDPCG